MNDTEREEWVNNDEGLYRWWRSTRMSMRLFVRTNRGDIDDTAAKARGFKEVPDHRTALQYHQDKAGWERWQRTHGEWAPGLPPK